MQKKKVIHRTVTAVAKAITDAVWSCVYSSPTPINANESLVDWLSTFTAWQIIEQDLTIATGKVRFSYFVGRFGGSENQWIIK